MLRILKHAATLALLSVGLVLLASCGKPATDQQPIKIGAIFAVTGPASFLGAPERRTAEMLVEQINAEGGINGRPLQLIVKDSQGKPELAISFAKQLIEEDQVFAIIGPSTSGETMQIKDICQQAQTILLSCAAAEVIVDPVAPYVFKTPQKDSYAALHIYQTMRQMGIDTIGVVCDNAGFGNAGRDQLIKYAPEMGIKLAIVETYAMDATDLTDVMTKVKNANVQAVVNWSIAPAQSIIAKNMRQIGLDVPLFQSHGFGNIKYVEMAGAAAEGIIFPCGRLLIAEELPEDHPQKALLMSYKQSYESRFNEPASTFGGHAYDAIILLVEAMRRAESLEREAVRSTLENLQGVVGTAGIFNFSPTDHNGLGMDSFAMLTVKNGKFVPFELE